MAEGTGRDSRQVGMNKMGKDKERIIFITL